MSSCMCVNGVCYRIDLFCKRFSLYKNYSLLILYGRLSDILDTVGCQVWHQLDTVNCQVMLLARYGKLSGMLLARYGKLSGNVIS